MAACHTGNSRKSGVAGVKAGGREDSVAVRVTDKATGSDWEGPHAFMWAAAPGRRGPSQDGGGKVRRGD